jgi:hypothetical protein
MFSSSVTLSSGVRINLTWTYYMNLLFLKTWGRGGGGCCAVILHAVTAHITQTVRSRKGSARTVWGFCECQSMLFWLLTLPFHVSHVILQVKTVRSSE